MLPRPLLSLLSSPAQTNQDQSHPVIQYNIPAHPIQVQLVGPGLQRSTHQGERQQDRVNKSRACYLHRLLAL